MGGLGNTKAPENTKTERKMNATTEHFMVIRKKNTRDMAIHGTSEILLPGV